MIKEWLINNTGETIELNKGYEIAPGDVLQKYDEEILKKFKIGGKEYMRKDGNIPDRAWLVFLKDWHPSNHDRLFIISDDSAGYVYEGERID